MVINKETIVTDDNKLIREKSKAVPLPLSDEHREILKSLYEYVYNSTIQEIATKEGLQPAVGIAAIQIGKPLKMLAVVLKDEEGKEVYRYALANPKILSHSIENAYLKSGEGCLSVPAEHQGYVYRHARIKIKAYDLFEDKEIIIKAKGYLAIVLQHEMDHFNGTLYYDHINKDNPFYEDPDAICIE